MEKVCRSCGTTLTQFYKTSMLGCPECYRVFSDELEKILKKLHGKTEHIGKTQVLSNVEKQMLFEYKTLIRSKEEAILDGRFEDANAISEEITQLKYELSRRRIL